MADYSKAGAAKAKQDAQDKIAQSGRDFDKLTGGSDADVDAAREGARQDGDQTIGQKYAEGKLKTTFFNPGAADFGGNPDSAAAYKQIARNHMADNDAEQGANNAAMQRSLANMRGASARPGSIENKLLSQREQDSRGVQGDAVRYSMDQAMGTAPSATAYQTRGAMNDAMAAQATSAGSARGLGGLAGSQIGATAHGAATGNIAAMGGNARAGEIGAGIQSYGQQAGQMTGQDMTRLGMSNQNGMFNRELNDKWGVGNAQLLASQGQLGNGYNAIDQGWFDESMSPEEMQFQLDQQAAGWAHGAESGKAGAQIAQGDERAKQTQALAGGLIQGGLTAVGSLAGPVGAAAGGMAGSAINAGTARYY